MAYLTIRKISGFDKFNRLKARTGHGWQDMDCRIRIAGHRYGHGLQDMDTDMDSRTWIAGQGLQDMDTDMNWSYEHAWCLQQKEFKSHRYIVYPV